MIKHIYILAWGLVIGTAIVSVHTGHLNEIGMVTFGLLTLALVHVLAVWSVLRDPGERRAG